MLAILFVLTVRINIFSKKFNDIIIENQKHESPEEKKEVDISFNDSVRTFIKQSNIKHSDIVYSQAVLESGHFKSKIFRENNNLFGMRKVVNRPTTQIGSCERGYGIYDSWKSSITDYAIWQAWSAKGLKENEFLNLLRSTYASDSTYITKILKIK